MDKIELGRLQSEGIFDFSLVDDQVNEESSEEEQNHVDYNERFDEFFSLPQRKRIEFERKKVEK